MKVARLKVTYSANMNHYYKWQRTKRMSKNREENNAGHCQAPWECWLGPACCKVGFVVCRSSGVSHPESWCGWIGRCFIGCLLCFYLLIVVCDFSGLFFLGQHILIFNFLLLHVSASTGAAVSMQEERVLLSLAWHFKKRAIRRKMGAGRSLRPSAIKNNVLKRSDLFFT